MPTASEILRAFSLGFSDGLDQPEDLTSGMTYKDEDRSEAYDIGATLGQKISRKFAPKPEEKVNAIRSR